MYFSARRVQCAMQCEGICLQESETSVEEMAKRTASEGDDGDVQMLIRVRDGKLDVLSDADPPRAFFAAAPLDSPEWRCGLHCWCWHACRAERRRRTSGRNVGPRSWTVLRQTTRMAKARRAGVVAACADTAARCAMEDAEQSRPRRVRPLIS